LLTSYQYADGIIYQKAVIFSSFADRRRLCHDSASSVSQALWSVSAAHAWRGALNVGAVGGGYI